MRPLLSLLKVSLFPLHLEKKESDFLVMGHTKKFNQADYSGCFSHIDLKQMRERGNSPKQNGATPRKINVSKASPIYKVVQWFSHNLRSFILFNNFIGIAREILYWQSYTITI